MNEMDQAVERYKQNVESYGARVKEIHAEGNTIHATVEFDVPMVQITLQKPDSVSDEDWQAFADELSRESYRRYE